MRKETEESLRMFLGGRDYTVQKLERDYLAELVDYSDERWEAPQRAARLAAAVKRYKTSSMLTFIFSTVAHDLDPDLTPLVVKRLCRALFGRTGSQWLIVEIFGNKRRSHRSDDSHPDVIDKIAAKYRDQAKLHWSTTLANIERVKYVYQKGIKASRNNGV